MRHDSRIPYARGASRIRKGRGTTRCSLALLRRAGGRRYGHWARTAPLLRNANALPYRPGWSPGAPAPFMPSVNQSNSAARASGAWPDVQRSAMRGLPGGVGFLCVLEQPQFVVATFSGGLRVRWSRNDIQSSVFGDRHRPWVSGAAVSMKGLHHD
jgi:hypothetical protein